MNAGLAKLIPHDLVYSKTARMAAHVGAAKCGEMADDRATKSIKPTLLRRTIASSSYRMVPSPIRAKGAQIAG
jgi:hypothetical protein